MHRLYRLGVRLVESQNGGFIVKHRSESSLVNDVKSTQHLDPVLIELNSDSLKITPTTSIYSFQVKCCGKPFGEISHDV